LTSLFSPYVTIRAHITRFGSRGEQTSSIILVSYFGVIAGFSAQILVKSLRASPDGKSDKLHITVVQLNKFAGMPWYQTLVSAKRDSLTQHATFVEVAGVDKTVFGVAVACGDGTLVVQPLHKEGAKDESASPIEVSFDVLVAATGSSFPVPQEEPHLHFSTLSS
jgi:hypothetical protein